MNEIQLLKLLPTLLTLALAVSIFTVTIAAIVYWLVVRGPKVREEVDGVVWIHGSNSATAKTGQAKDSLDEKPLTSESLPGSLTFLVIPAYLRSHLIKRCGITTISQIGELCDPPAGTKAKWPYGLGKARQKIIRDAYFEYENSKVKKDIEGES